MRTTVAYFARLVVLTAFLAGGRGTYLAAAAPVFTREEAATLYAARPPVQPVEETSPVLLAPVHVTGSRFPARRSLNREEDARSLREAVRVLAPAEAARATALARSHDAFFDRRAASIGTDVPKGVEFSVPQTLARFKTQGLRALFSGP